VQRLSRPAIGHARRDGGSAHPEAALRQLLPSLPGATPAGREGARRGRAGGRIVPVAVSVAVGVNSDGRREVLGMDIGPSEAETFWTEFLRKLARRGLRGVNLVISDAHEGIKAAVAHAPDRRATARTER
jgi:Transposase, Mutator family